MIDQQTEAELQLQLETVRKENLAAQERLAEQQQNAAAAQKERQEIAFNTNLERAIAGTGLKTLSVVDPKEFLDVVKSFLRFDVKADGSFDVIDGKGRSVDFDDAFREFAIQRAVFFDGRSLRSLQTPPDELCKSEMTTAQKSAYVAKFGLAAFEKIPLLAPNKYNLATLDAATYSKLSPAEKAKIIAKIGEAGVSEILRRR
jgi:hypothetical protein